jgi:hypothetical protein
MAINGFGVPTISQDGSNTATVSVRHNGTSSGTLQLIATDTATGQQYVVGTEQFQITGGGNGTVSVTFEPNTIGTLPPGTYTFNVTGAGIVGPSTSAIPVVCFAEGTEILTARGEVRVETLRAGDLVATVSGQGAPMKPVLWVGRRKVVLAGNPAADALRPVRIAAGALGEATPHRDLLVSPDHCLYLDGALVPARLLVNGLTVTIERGLGEVAYFHVELEDHDVLLANGAAAESWLDAGNRAWFENAPVALLQVADAPDAYGTADGATPCAPVVQGGERLAAIRDAIALRADILPGDRPAEPPIRSAATG